MADKQKVVFQAAQKFAERGSLTMKPRARVAPHADRYDEDDPGGWCAWPCRASHAEQSDTAPLKSEPPPRAAR